MIYELANVLKKSRAKTGEGRYGKVGRERSQLGCVIKAVSCLVNDDW